MKAMKYLIMNLAILFYASHIFGQSDKAEVSWKEATTEIKFLYISGVTFVICSTDTEDVCQQLAETHHPVTVWDFLLAESEVTQA